MWAGSYWGKSFWSGRYWAPSSSSGAFILVATTRAYPFTGLDANLAWGRHAFVDAGAFVLNGQDAAMAYGRTMALEPGEFILTGNNAVLLYGDTTDGQGDWIVFARRRRSRM